MIKQTHWSRPGVCYSHISSMYGQGPGESCSEGLRFVGDVTHEPQLGLVTITFTESKINTYLPMYVQLACPKWLCLQ